MNELSHHNAGSVEMVPGQESVETLSKRLYQLPPDKFIELYRLYEQLGWQTQVVDEMEVLRRRLTRMRPRRGPSFTRLLCQPFEFFIGDDPDIAPFHVPRQCCRELSKLVKGLMEADELTRMQDRIKNIDPNDAQLIEQISDQLWQSVGRVLTRLKDQRRKTLSVQLRANLDLIIGCLMMGPAMRALGGGTGDKLQDLDMRGREVLSRIVNAVPDDKSGLLRYPLIMLSRRLENPSNIVAIVQRPDIAIPASVRILLVEMMQSYLESELMSVTENTTDLISEANEKGETVHLPVLRRSIRAAADSRAAGVASNAARDLLKTISQHVSDTLIEPATVRLENDLEAFFSDQQTQGGNNPFAQAGNALADAEACLLSLTDLSKDAQALSLGLEIARLSDTWCRRITADAEAQLSRIQQADTAEEGIARLSKLYGLVRLLEILDGPDRAESVRRSGEKAYERLKAA